jgi:nucleolar GTP-binding protein
VGKPMLERVPTILSAQEILDKAFLKANKLEVPDPDKYHRIRKTEEAQMKHIAETCAEALARYVAAFPNFERMSSYEQELLDIVVGLDDLKKALGHVSWTEEKITDVYRQCARSMREMRNTTGIQAQKRRFSGRCASLLKDCDKDLTFLREARDRVRMLPTIHAEYPTVVIAGFPNVGKSSLLAAWTRATPEIAAYAFTTKAANVGHFPIKGAHGKDTFVQVVDTPGLLDRPASKRNAVEKQAVAALRHAADAVLFLIDMSETSGYSIAEQEHLLAQTEREMSGIPLVVAETKADLVRSTTDRLKISPLTGEGLPALQDAITKVLPLEEPELERDPLELWKSKRDPMFG